MKNFAITYRKWSNTKTNHDFVGETTTENSFTKREAIAHLEANGFAPWGTKARKLPSVFTNDKGTMAYIVKR